MTFRKGSTRHEILEGLRELKMDSVLKFTQIYGSKDPHARQTVHEVIAAIPRNRLAEALVVIERSAKKIDDRAAIQAAAKLYIERVNHKNLKADENRDAIKESTAKLLPPNKRGDIMSVMGAMGKMAHEIILSGIDTVINAKKYDSFNVTPEEMEKLMSDMREGKIGFFGNPPNSDLVHRTPPPEKDFYEYGVYRQALVDEVYALAGLTRETGWFNDDTPGIPKEKFEAAINFLFMLPEFEGHGYLPHGITASPDGTVTFWWKHYKKSVTFAITNYANFSWQLKYSGSFPQDNHDRFCMLTPNGIEYLIVDLKKMYS